jgi:hypothetical protein
MLFYSPRLKVMQTYTLFCTAHGIDPAAGYECQTFVLLIYSGFNRVWKWYNDYHRNTWCHLHDRKLLHVTDQLHSGILLNANSKIRTPCLLLYRDPTPSQATGYRLADRNSVPGKMEHHFHWIFVWNRIKPIQKYLTVPPPLFFPVALRPKVGHGLLILEVSRTHTTTYHSR